MTSQINLDTNLVVSWCLRNPSRDIEHSSPTLHRKSTKLFRIYTDETESARRAACLHVRQRGVSRRLPARTREGRSPRACATNQPTLPNCQHPDLWQTFGVTAVVLATICDETFPLDHKKILWSSSSCYFPVAFLPSALLPGDDDR